MDVPGVTLDRGPGGLERVVVARPTATAELTLHGATLTRFAPAGAGPLLWVAPRAIFAESAAIRGGVPLCFPWFGPREGAAQHGFARTRRWELGDVREDGDAVVLELGLEDDETTRALWPARFRVRYAVRIGRALDLELAVENRGDGLLSYEVALHAYLSVGDVREVEVTGLAGAATIDKVAGGARGVTSADPLRLTGETDRVHLGTPGPVVVTDQRLGRRITITKEGAPSTVVWNPWETKARAMKDVGDDSWTTMVCVEPGNVADDAVTLAPGARHATRCRFAID